MTFSYKKKLKNFVLSLRHLLVMVKCFLSLSYLVIPFFPGASLVTPKKVSVFQLPHSTSAFPVTIFENASLELFNTKVTSLCLQLLVRKSQLSGSPLFPNSTQLVKLGLHAPGFNLGKLTVIYCLHHHLKRYSTEVVFIFVYLG